MKPRNDRRHLPVAFPSGPRVDAFPALLTAPLTAVTVFTTFPVPAPADAPPYAPPSAAAICACGDMWRGDSALLLRRMLGSHRCVEDRARPIELVPIDDEPDDATIARVLDGLRAL